MNITQSIKVLSTYIDSDIPAFLWGSPGIGKSDIVVGLAALRGLPLIDLRAALLDPLDLRGLPKISGDVVQWLPMGELPIESRDGSEGILFLDELNAAAPAVQAACFQLVLNRRIGTYHLPAGWRIVAAGNRQSDRASAQRLSSALADRFAHIEVDCDLDSWCRWAIAKGKPAEVVAFLRFRPELLHDFDPDRLINATPRGWGERVCALVSAGLEKTTELLALAGSVGEGPAAEFTAFLRVWRTLPSPDGLLLSPDSGDMPSDPATLFALMGALSRKVTEQSMANFVRILGRAPVEYGVAAMRDAVTRDPLLQNTSGFVSWSAANSDVVS